MPNQFSNSKLNSFKTCKLQYKYRYIDKIESKSRGIEAFLGNCVHEALEQLYLDVMMTKVMSEEELLGLYQSAWKKGWNDKIKIVKKRYSVEDYFKIGEKCLKDYYKKEAPFDGDRTLAVEKRVTYPLLDEERGIQYTLMGLVDRLCETEPGHYEIHDFKTSGSLPDQSKLDMDRQLAIYQLALEDELPDVKEVTLKWHFLKFGKTFSSKRTKEDLENLKLEVLEIIREVESTTEYPAEKNPLCDWCDYQRICPIWRHMFLEEELSEDERKKEPGNVLVEKYSEVKDQIKDLKEDSEVLKEELVEYAKENDCEVIYGEDHQVKVGISDDYSLPSSGDAEREELEELIKKLGLWDGVTSMSTTKVKALLKDSELDESVRKKILDYCEKVESVRVTVGKRKE